MYIIRVFVFFSSFLCAFFALFLLKLITIIDRIYYNNIANNIIISRLLMLVFIFLFNLFVNFSSKFIIQLFFLNLFLTIILYIKLITILNIVKLIIRFKYIYINKKYILICKIKHKITL